MFYLSPVPLEGTYCVIRDMPIHVELRGPNQVGQPVRTVVDMFIPKGFCTNGANIPSTLWKFIGSPFDPGIIRAATVHDYLYCAGEQSRLVSDEVFKTLLIEDGVASWKANLMYAGVRMFGAGYYKDSILTKLDGPQMARLGIGVDYVA